jgi:bifunctional DNA-binding transcriptional regulator/antitoxin component of YhaV-PrlF toxin-antitoxin module
LTKGKNKDILFYENNEVRNQGEEDMLAKVTSKNQITIPKKIMEQFPDVQYFDLELKDGVVVLKPLKTYDTNLDQIRDKIKSLGLKPNSVNEAVKWARSR